MTNAYDHSERPVFKRLAPLVVMVLLVVGWFCLLWLWVVEYPKRLELFAEERLKIPHFMQSVMRLLPLLVLWQEP